MNTIFWHSFEAFELDYTNKFHGIIRMELTEDDKIRCEIVLEDNKEPKREDLIIGIITSDKDAADGCRFYATNLLHNEEFCKDCWRDYIKKEDNR